MAEDFDRFDIARLDDGEVGRAFRTALRSAQAGRSTYVEAGALVLGGVIPAEDVHEPGRCCCQHCPWDGNHGVPEQDPPRVRVYDEHGEPFELVLRTKTGRVLTEADLDRLAAEAES